MDPVVPGPVNAVMARWKGGPDLRGWEHLNLAALLLIGFLIGIGQVLGVVFHPIDAVIYWRTELDALYGVHWFADGTSGYVYPPPFAQLLAVPHLLGWPVFVVLWTTLCFWCLWYLAGRWTPVVLGFGVLALFGILPPLGAPVGYALLGNVQLPMAAAIVAGMRQPAWWAVPLLTKAGPGVGLLWFVVRREWRNLGFALGTTLLIAAVSFAFAPSLWFDWVRFISDNAAAPSVIPLVPIPFAVRVLMSAAVVIWGARTDRIWTVPIAAGWAIPALYEWSFLPVWLGALRLHSIAAPRSRQAPLNPAESSVGVRAG